MYFAKTIKYRYCGLALLLISLLINVAAFAFILKRAKAQKTSHWKHDIFADTEQYKEAMERAE